MRLTIGLKKRQGALASVDIEGPVKGVVVMLGDLASRIRPQSLLRYRNRDESRAWSLLGQASDLFGGDHARH